MRMNAKNKETPEIERFFCSPHMNMYKHVLSNKMRAHGQKPNDLNCDCVRFMHFGCVCISKSVHLCVSTRISVPKPTYCNNKSEKFKQLPYKCTHTQTRIHHGNKLYGVRCADHSHTTAILIESLIINMSAYFDKTSQMIHKHA